MPKEQAFVAIPGEKLLEAIGEVSVKWAALEWQLDNMLFWASDPADAETDKLIREGSARARWRRLKDIVKLEHATHPGTLGLTMLIDDCLSLKGERDKVVHGVYGDHTSPETAMLMMMQGGYEKGRGWAVTRPKVLEVARKVDEMARRLADYRMTYAQPLDPAGSSFRMNAWRHKERAQD